MPANDTQNIQTENNNKVSQLLSNHKLAIIAFMANLNDISRLKDMFKQFPASSDTVESANPVEFVFNTLVAQIQSFEQKVEERDEKLDTANPVQDISVLLQSAVAVIKSFVKALKGNEATRHRSLFVRFVNLCITILNKNPLLKTKLKLYNPGETQTEKKAFIATRALEAIIEEAPAAEAKGSDEAQGAEDSSFSAAPDGEGTMPAFDHNSWDRVAMQQTPHKGSLSHSDLPRNSTELEALQSEGQSLVEGRAGQHQEQEQVEVVSTTPVVDEALEALAGIMLQQKEGELAAATSGTASNSFDSGVKAVTPKPAGEAAAEMPEEQAIAEAEVLTQDRVEKLSGAKKEKLAFAIDRFLFNKDDGELQYLAEKLAESTEVLSVALCNDRSFIEYVGKFEFAALAILAQRPAVLAKRSPELINSILMSSFKVIEKVFNRDDQKDPRKLLLALDAMAPTLDREGAASSCPAIDADARKFALLSLVYEKCKQGNSRSEVLEYIAEASAKLLFSEGFSLKFDRLNRFLKQSSDELMAIMPDNSVGQYFRSSMMAALRSRRISAHDFSMLLVNDSAFSKAAGNFQLESVRSLVTLKNRFEVSPEFFDFDLKSLEFKQDADWEKMYTACKTEDSFRGRFSEIATLLLSDALPKEVKHQYDDLKIQSWSRSLKKCFMEECFYSLLTDLSLSVLSPEKKLARIIDLVKDLWFAENGAQVCVFEEKRFMSMLEGKYSELSSEGHASQTLHLSCLGKQFKKLAVSKEGGVFGRLALGQAAPVCTKLGLLFVRFSKDKSRTLAFQHLMAVLKEPTVFDNSALDSFNKFMLMYSLPSKQNALDKLCEAFRLTCHRDRTGAFHIAGNVIHMLRLNKKSSVLQGLSKKINYLAISAHVSVEVSSEKVVDMSPASSDQAAAVEPAVAPLAAGFLEPSLDPFAAKLHSAVSGGKSANLAVSIVSLQKKVAIKEQRDAMRLQKEERRAQAAKKTAEGSKGGPRFFQNMPKRVRDVQQAPTRKALEDEDKAWADFAGKEDEATSNTL